MKIIVHGYKGYMGQVLVGLISTSGYYEIAAGIDINGTAESFPTFQSAKECNVAADVIIDFSHHSAVNDVLQMAADRRVPIVVATTGLTENEKAGLSEAAKVIPVLHSANMSFGINLMLRQLEMLVPTLEDAFNIEIVEKHHNRKKDSPSGTALLLADAISRASAMERQYVWGRHGSQDVRNISDIGIHAVRGGTIPGEHTVIFAGSDEIIEIKHTALSRSIFARGALGAAAYLVKMTPGLYTMDDVLK